MTRGKEPYRIDCKLSANPELISRLFSITQQAGIKPKPINLLLASASVIKAVFFILPHLP